MFSIEFDEPISSLCACCGNIEKRISASVFFGETMVAFYMTSLPGHAGLPLSILAFWGDFGDEAKQTDRLAATFAVMNVPEQNGYGTSITDPEEAGWPPTDTAVYLSKEEATAKHAERLYTLSDLILDKDKMIRAYLDLPVTTH